MLAGEGVTGASLLAASVFDKTNCASFANLITPRSAYCGQITCFCHGITSALESREKGRESARSPAGFFHRSIWQPSRVERLVGLNKI